MDIHLYQNFQFSDFYVKNCKEKKLIFKACKYHNLEI